MPDSKAGIAAGVLAMNRVVAGAIALGAIGALYQHLEATGIAAGESRSTAISDALATSAWALVGLCALGVVLTCAFVRSSPQEARPGPAHHRRFHL